VLEGEMPRRLVAALGARRIPFVVVVGDSPGCAAGLPSLERVPWIGKPLTGRKILLALICALNGPH
jgi:hypothetical protein